MTATSDVYLIPAAGKKKKDAKVWRFAVEYKLGTINLIQIASET